MKKLRRLLFISCIAFNALHLQASNTMTSKMKKGETIPVYYERIYVERAEQDSKRAIELEKEKEKEREGYWQEVSAEQMKQWEIEDAEDAKERMATAAAAKIMQDCALARPSATVNPEHAKLHSYFKKATDESIENLTDTPAATTPLINNLYSFNHNHSATSIINTKLLIAKNLAKYNEAEVQKIIKKGMSSEFIDNFSPTARDLKDFSVEHIIDYEEAIRRIKKKDSLRPNQIGHKKATRHFILEKIG